MVFGTGITALDKILDGIMPGDNIVFQVNSLEDFLPFVHAFGDYTIHSKIKLIYFRFADHEPLIPSNLKAKIITLKPEEGFEIFIDKIIRVIEKYGDGFCYIFDSLSELAVDWYSDKMVANFFMLTCPFLFDYKTVAYFVLFRDRHSDYTVSKIHKTAQVVLDVYKKESTQYIHPLKVWKRSSPTMYMLHIRNGDKFLPIRLSAEISEILANYEQLWADMSIKLHNIRSRIFSQAHQMLQDFRLGTSKYYELEPIKEKIIRMIITRDPKLSANAQKYFDLKDLLDIGRRMIGTGLIGGKSVGMLLAQAILKKSDTKWEKRLEHHDSFFLGSDVFYTYLVLNKCWWKRYRIKNSEYFLDLAKEARDILKNGKFPRDIIEQFKQMLNYFGQSPIIVRSSSLLEDTYGNAFSGKYKSVFLANQGAPEERLNAFINAVRAVYASTMSEEALMYRLNRNLLDKDEQMAILVQRVSGASYGDLFYPQLAGVGYSFNSFIWNEEIDPEAGLIRLVFGLGTRAVERHDDDYTRIVALNLPERRPEADKDERQKYNQRKVDILNLKENKFISSYFDEIILNSPNLSIDLFGARNFDAENDFRQRGKEKIIFYLDLDKSILKTSIIQDMREILNTLKKVYDYHVDIEFTINFTSENSYKIYVLQCRPLQIKTGGEQFEEPNNIEEKDIILKSYGPIIGNGIAKTINKLIYVSPEEYSKLSIQERYGVARIIGKLNNIYKDSENEVVFLAGPGRWATSSPSLGVPVSFHEICSISIICEIAEMHENLNPDVSLGTHFFNDLVENDMIYIALNPRNSASILNRKRLDQFENMIGNLIPNGEKYKNLIKVIGGMEDKKIKLFADPVKQVAILYIEQGGG